MFLYGIDPKTEERGFFCVTAEGKIFFADTTQRHFGKNKPSSVFIFFRLNLDIFRDVRQTLG
jgi:hypothetical protein